MYTPTKQETISDNLFIDSLEIPDLKRLCQFVRDYGSWGFEWRTIDGVDVVLFNTPNGSESMFSFIDGDIRETFEDELQDPVGVDELIEAWSAGCDDESGFYSDGCPRC